MRIKENKKDRAEKKLPNPSPSHPKIYQGEIYKPQENPSPFP